jgi:hypothetical protein
MWLVTSNKVTCGVVLSRNNFSFIKKTFSLKI